MTSDPSPRIDHHFQSLTDPRRGKLTHPLINILTIALCATIAGADDFVAMADWARQHKDWLARLLYLANGIPSHDRLNMVFRRLKPAEFERCLLSWLAALHDTSAGRLLAIDGKTARQSFHTATAKSALHMVSVWAVSQRLSIASVAVEKKGNEITAIPEVRKRGEWCGAVGTIAGSPMPFTPRGPIGSGSSTMIGLTRGTSSDVGKMYLAKPCVEVWPSRS